MRVLFISIKHTCINYSGAEFLVRNCKDLRVKEKYIYREESGHRGCPFAHVHVLASKRRRVLLVFEERNGNAAGRREARMTGTWVRPKEPRVRCQLAREILGRTLHRKTFFDLPIRIWRYVVVKIQRIPWNIQITFGQTSLQIWH